MADLQDERKLSRQLKYPSAHGSGDRGRRIPIPKPSSPKMLTKTAIKLQANRSSRLALDSFAQPVTQFAQNRDALIDRTGLGIALVLCTRLTQLAENRAARVGRTGRSIARLHRRLRRKARVRSSSKTQQNLPSSEHEVEAHEVLLWLGSTHSAVASDCGVWAQHSSVAQRSRFHPAPSACL